MLNQKNFHLIKIKFSGKYDITTAGSLLSKLDDAFENLDFTILEICHIVVGDDSTDIDVFGYTHLEYEPLLVALNSALAKKFDDFSLL